MSITKMAKISKDLLRKLVEEGFLDNDRHVEEVVEKLDQKGFSIRGKKVGLIGQLLTFLCQDSLLERKKDENGRWMYRKIKKS